MVKVLVKTRMYWANLVEGGRKIRVLVEELINIRDFDIVEFKKFPSAFPVLIIETGRHKKLGYTAPVRLIWVGQPPKIDAAYGSLKDLAEQFIGDP